MTFWLSVLIFFIILGLLVFIHELGHFLAAKLIKAKVEEFAFGFGPRIISKKIGETEYRINAIPAGGYVKILGESIGSELSTDSEQLKKIWKQKKLGEIKERDELIRSIEGIESLSKDEKKDFKEIALQYFEAKYSKRSFSNKNAAQRFLVLISGVTMNFLLAVIIFTVYLMLNNFVAQEFVRAVDYKFIGADAIVTEMPLIEHVYDQELKDQGISGSMILELNGKRIESKQEVLDFLEENINKEADFKFLTETGVIQRKIVLNSDKLDTNLDSEIRGKVFIAQILKDSPAESAGFKPGTIILEVNGEPVDTAKEFGEILDRYEGEKITMKVIDDLGVEKEVSVSLRTKTKEEDTTFGAGFGDNSITTLEFYKLDYSKYKVFSGFSHSVNILGYQVKVLSALVQRSFQERDIAPVGLAVGSVATVADTVNSLVSSSNFVSILNLTGLVSVALAFMNILPIPLFDGGHIFFLIIEKIRGRKLSPKREEMISSISFLIIIILSIVVLLKDIIVLNWIGRSMDFVKKLASGDQSAGQTFWIGMVIILVIVLIWKRRQILALILSRD